MLYRNTETGELFTENEIKELCCLFYSEAGHETPEEYYNYIIDSMETQEEKTN